MHYIALKKPARSSCKSACVIKDIALQGLRLAGRYIITHAVRMIASLFRF